MPNSGHRIQLAGASLGLRNGPHRATSDGFEFRLPLKFLRISRILRKRTSLSATFAVGRPAGGEMSGLMAHFLFGANSRDIWPLSGGWTAIFRRQLFAAGVQTMAANLDEIRAAAQRVAASHGLDVVEVDFSGRGKERILRVALEKNAEG